MKGKRVWISRDVGCIRVFIWKFRPKVSSGFFGEWQEPWAEAVANWPGIKEKECREFILKPVTGKKGGGKK